MCWDPSSVGDDRLGPDKPPPMESLPLHRFGTHHPQRQLRTAGTVAKVMSREGAVERRDGKVLSRRDSTCRGRPIVTAGGSAKGDDSWRVDSFDWNFREHTSQLPYNGRCYPTLGTSCEPSDTHKDNNLET